MNRPAVRVVAADGGFTINADAGGINLSIQVQDDTRRPIPAFAATAPRAPSGGAPTPAPTPTPRP